MPDFATAGAAFSAITQALDTAKMLKELGKRLDNAEIIAQVADLTMNLAEVKVQLATQHIWTIARNELARFAHLVATARHSFIFPMAFSTMWRILYRKTSYSRNRLRFLRGGITAFAPECSMSSTIS